MSKHNIQEETVASNAFQELFRGARGLPKAKWKAAYYKQNHPGKGSKTPWTTEQIDRILGREVADRFLALELGRSISAIQTQRVRCKKRLEQNLAPYEP